jgi:hypothetical protein
MKTRITTGFAVLALVAGAAHAEPQPSRVVQAFACNLSDGQTSEDVWALMDALRANAETMDSPDPANGLFLWLPYRGATPYDFLVGVISSDLNAMAAGSMAFQASPGVADIRARFQKMAGCDSGILISDQLSDGKIGMTGGDRVPDAAVETFRCNFKDGSDMDDWNDAVKFWQEQIPKLNSAAVNEYEAYQWTPLRGGTGADVFWVGNSTDLASWAQSTSDYEASEAGREANERFQEVSTCTSQMWMGYWIDTPEEF